MNTDLFSTKHSNVPAADTRNTAGGKAYKLSTAASLAKYAMTGTFGTTYQASAEEQLDRVLKLCQECDPEFVAKVAVHSRKNGRMKDVPALLCAYLAHTNIDLCKRIFPKVIDDSKMLRNFVQIIRSGVIGRKSLGTAPKKLVQGYLNSLTDEQLFKSDVGNNPSLPDIIKMVHPRPATKEREALYAYLLGREPKKDGDKDVLLPLAHEFEAFKKDLKRPVPNVPFQMLTSLPLTEDNYKTIARNASFNQLRLNLNNFERHGVFKDPEIVDFVAAKLSNPEEVRRSRVMPYQLFMTFMSIDVHQKIKNALQDAVEVALDNVPQIQGDIVIALDTSGSMTRRLTGDRGSVTTKVRHIDVASVFAAALLRHNKNGLLLPFDTEVRKIDINSRDSIMTNAQKLAAIRGGGTDCSVAIGYLNDNKIKASAVIYLSDCESWKAYAGKKYNHSTRGTGMMEEWSQFVKSNPNAKLINIDTTPSDTSQVTTSPNTLLVGGFNDAVLDVVASFLRQDYEADEYWTAMISDIKI